MEWYSEPFVIKAKEKKINGRFTNYYLVREYEYYTDKKEKKTNDEWLSVPKDIYSSFEVGDKVYLLRNDFWFKKIHYDVIKECNPSK